MVKDRLPTQMSGRRKTMKYLKSKIKMWIYFKIKRTIKTWVEILFIIPINSRRPLMKVKWVDLYDFRTDSIISGGEPRCPRCDELPYNSEQCLFCGQRFTKESEGKA